MSWYLLTEECLAARGCSNPQICAAIENDGGEKTIRKMRQEQKDIRRAAKAVQRAYELNPTASRTAMREQACKFAISSIFLSLIIQVVLSYAITWAIDWLLDRIFDKDEVDPDGVVQVSPE
jgi:hypothetical protein